jgi:hypothetical protein
LRTLILYRYLLKINCSAKFLFSTKVTRPIEMQVLTFDRIYKFIEIWTNNEIFIWWTQLTRTKITLVSIKSFMKFFRKRIRFSNSVFETLLVSKYYASMPLLVCEPICAVSKFTCEYYEYYVNMCMSICDNVNILTSHTHRHTSIVLTYSQCFD